jgi:two-component system, chemotaxis family, protein-glutamate methylesterase/glutaminase
MENNKVNVLIIDDSALVRATLTSVFDSDEGIRVIGSCADPYIAVEKMAKEAPDVITLDIEMPRMDGLTFLKKLMSQHPIPVIVISTLTPQGSETALKALELGALMVIEKPKLNTKSELEEATKKLCAYIKEAKHAKVKKLSTLHTETKQESSIRSQKQNNARLTTTSDKIIAIGASTGGTEALKEILLEMPGDSPAVLIVQHMPELFTRQFAERLNQICEMVVKEATHNETVIQGHVYIAPGNKHMMVVRRGARYYIELNDDAPVNRHRPSVDVLFHSVANHVGKNAVAAILTGMGADGAKGMLSMKEADVYTIAQDEQSCVVYGMPKEAVKQGGVALVLPLNKIAKALIDKVVKL